jgi:hypothetical protein
MGFSDAYYDEVSIKHNSTCYRSLLPAKRKSDAVMQDRILKFRIN